MTLDDPMKNSLLRTSVIGSYPFPSWLYHAVNNLKEFGADDIAEMKDDATTCAIQDQLRAGLDVITDGEQTRLDFNLSFYGHLNGISMEPESPRKFGPPAHDQRGKHEIIDELSAPNGLGTVEEFRRLKKVKKDRLRKIQEQDKRLREDNLFEDELKKRRVLTDSKFNYKVKSTALNKKTLNF